MLPIVFTSSLQSHMPCRDTYCPIHMPHSHVWVKDKKWSINEIFIISPHGVLWSAESTRDSNTHTHYTAVCLLACVPECLSVFLIVCVCLAVSCVSPNPNPVHTCLLTLLSPSLTVCICLSVNYPCLSDWLSASVYLSVYLFVWLYMSVYLSF